MPSISKDSLVGTLIPNVYIKKILIESSAGGDHLHERDPHIDHEREPDVILDPDTGKLKRISERASLLDKQAEGETLKIRVDLAVKEILNNSLVATWFGNQDFLKYLKVGVLQSRAEQTTRTIIEGSLPFLELQKIMRNRDDVRIISLKEAVASRAMYQQQNYVDQDGARIYGISFSETFIVDNYNPPHLSYAAVAFLDTAQMISDFGMDMNMSNFQSIDGRMATEVVIDQSVIASQSYVFLEESGAVWVGPVHKDGEKWLTGNKTIPTSRILTAKIVNNSKVNDFRTIRDLERLDLDFTSVEKISGGIDLSQARRINKDLLGPQNNFNHITDVELSRNKDGTCSFMFAVNLLQAAKDNTVFGSLYRQDNKELLQNIRIQNLRIVRQRVNREGVGYKDERGFSSFVETETERPEVIVSSAETSPGAFKTAATNRGTIQEGKIKSTQGMRHFFGKDLSMGKVTFGLYKYIVQFDIEDGTVTYLKKNLELLIDAHDKLNTYLAQGSQRGNYDPYTDQFTEKFFTEQRDRYTQSNKPWLIAPQRYVYALSIFSENIDVAGTINALMSFTHPQVGSVVGVMKLKDLMSDLITKISNLIGYGISGREKKQLTGMSQVSQTKIKTRGSVPRRVFTISGYSHGEFDSDIPKNLGFDFLTLGSEDRLGGLGISVLPVEKYEKRIELETLKYFTPDAVDISLRVNNRILTIDDSVNTTKYSYLTPSVVSVGDFIPPVELAGKGSAIFNISKANLVASAASAIKTLKNSPQFMMPPFVPSGNSTLHSNDQATKAALTKAAAGSGMQIMSLTHFFKIKTGGSPDGVVDLPSSYVTSLGKKALDSTYLQPKASDFAGEAGKFFNNPRLLKANLNPAVISATQSPPRARLLRTLPSGTGPRKILKSSKVFGVKSINNSFTLNDLIVRENRECESGGEDRESLNLNPNALLTAIYNPMFLDGPQNGFGYKKSKEMSLLNKNTLKYFDLFGDNNLIQDLKLGAATSKQAADFFGEEIFTSIANDKNSVVENSKLSITKEKEVLLKTLPNQIKALLVQSVSPEKVTKSWFAEGGNSVDPITDPNQTAVFKLHHNTINEVESLEGYEVSKDGAVEVKKPIWKKLTSKQIDAAGKDPIICRMKSYANNDIGVARPESFNLPTYNEHFILSANDDIEGSEKQEEQKKSTINAQAESFDEQHQDIPAEYTSTTAVFMGRNK